MSNSKDKIYKEISEAFNWDAILDSALESSEKPVAKMTMEDVTKTSALHMMDLLFGDEGKKDDSINVYSSLELSDDCKFIESYIWIQGERFTVNRDEIGGEICETLGFWSEDGGLPGSVDAAKTIIKSLQGYIDECEGD